VAQPASYYLTLEQQDLFTDLVAIYKPWYPYDPDTGQQWDAQYGPLPTSETVPCYRETKKEAKVPSPIGASLENNLFTEDVFHFANGIDVGSNYFLQYLGNINGPQPQNQSPDLEMWFCVQGLPQPLLAETSNNLEVISKRETRPKGVVPTWPQTLVTAPWPTREGAGLLVLGGAMFLFGGNAGVTQYNDVWVTVDGLTWTNVQPSAPWSARSEFASAVFNNELWLFGGSPDGGTTFLNDAWSSVDGVTWMERTASAAWPARSGHNVIQLGTTLYLMGGLGAGATYYHDLWSSVDGITWTPGTNAPWPARTGAGAIVNSGTAYLLGGNNASTKFNDVWVLTSNLQWDQLQTPVPLWTTRTAFGVAYFSNCFWILGGLTGAGEVNEVWVSIDMVTWTQLANASWPVRSNLSVAVFNSSLWVMGGYTGVTTLNDVWSTRG
jgi:hypothetical protein